MTGRLISLALVPFMSGCVVVQHRHSIVDLGKLAGPLSDTDLVGTLLLIAALFGLAGGIVAWISARYFSGWRTRQREKMAGSASNAPC